MGSNVKMNYEFRNFQFLLSFIISVIKSIKQKRKLSTNDSIEIISTIFERIYTKFITSIKKKNTKIFDFYSKRKLSFTFVHCKPLFQLVSF